MVEACVHDHTVITRFGYPLEVVSDQGTNFVNDVITELMNFI